MKLHIVVGVMIAIGALRGAAHADGIVLESYTGERPADASRLLTPVLEELSKKKFEAGEGVARKFDAQVSRPSRASKGVPSDFAAQVDKGFKAWVGGDFNQSIKILQPLIDLAHANSAQFAVNPDLLNPLQKALIALSLAQARIGDQGAMSSTMKELIRSFPQAQISRATYGPDAASAFERVRKEVAAQGMGKLSVELTDDAAVVFINEAYRGPGSTTVDLVPGDYRVLVLLNKQPSRAHRVTVTANATAKLSIDVAFDIAVRTTGHTGFSYASDEDRQAKESTHAAQFARAVNANAVAVVGIDDVRGKPSVVGVLVSLQDGREIRRASIPLDPDPSNKLLASLARFLAGDDPDPGLAVEVARTPEAIKPGGETSVRRDGGPEPSTTSNRWGGWRFITGFLGVGGLVAGGILVALDGNCSVDPPQGQPCNDLYATATPGYIALGAGAVFTGISIYLFATHKTVPTVQAAQGGGGATLGFMTRW